MSYVAEVWLSYEICRGSTMYRATAKTERGAKLKAKIAAMKLDVLLPKFYWDTDWRGRPCRYAHEFGILYGIRKPTEREETEGVTAFFSTSLPGTRGFTGEHASAHPLDQSAQSGLESFKI
ncbi:hypothetical protein WL29_22785 [Burkholderia ubonensis]|uniref:Uncharacterized protein n=1 Tax=Burkholderia ubonensis TaxID=101571 RepID=A0A106QBZ3_9BURK|nr:hypothetical protein [Burkholderia ubonensis]KWA84190.1 hypothetical protein WL29_22785 [Burkholderia ubonensis]